MVFRDFYACFVRFAMFFLFDMPVRERILQLNSFLDLYLFILRFSWFIIILIRLDLCTLHLLHALLLLITCGCTFCIILRFPRLQMDL
jgi:hypothetical protein